MFLSKQRSKISKEGLKEFKGDYVFISKQRSSAHSRRGVSGLVVPSKGTIDSSGVFKLVVEFHSLPMEFGFQSCRLARFRF